MKKIFAVIDFDGSYHSSGTVRGVYDSEYLALCRVTDLEVAVLEGAELGSYEFEVREYKEGVPLDVDSIGMPLDYRACVDYEVRTVAAHSDEM